MTVSPADAQLIQLWVHGRSRHTRRYYQADAQRFLTFVNKPLAQVTLADVQDFADSLEMGNLAPSSCGRTISSVKSLLAFGSQIGVLPINVGAPLKAPTAKNTLAERILSEVEVQRLISLEPNVRNQVMLKLLYTAGLRVSELCSLRWRDLQARNENEGQANIYGKGGKTRVVLLPASIWSEIMSLRGASGFNDPVFQSRKGGHLHPSQVMRIVRAAAQRAGIDANVSPHWLRHAHASHALDRGAPIHLVQSTLGHTSIATTGKYLHARPQDSSARYLEV
ncbi:MAG: tyrosine-type recombinase/integrase [Chroococcidiopsidaceae cyanobacterium CP_BM_ER_R8_30]|nr:tyrosine-type recombinase/integrase [Chroococcidiopsidaceae cyanobacterium CP_BM_ER_R8_30]